SVFASVATTTAFQAFPGDACNSRIALNHAVAEPSGSSCPLCYGRPRRDAPQLAPLPDLRPDGVRDPGLDGGDELRLRAAAEPADTRAQHPVRVRRLAGAAAPPALHGQLLPDRDALHRLRHRDRVP